MPPPTCPPPATPTPTSTDPEAAALVPPVPAPWYAALAGLVTAGRLTVAVADVIRTGLGEITDDVTADDLETALAELLDRPPRRAMAATGCTWPKPAPPPAPCATASTPPGVAVREAVLREKQYWRQWISPDGSYRGEYALSPENGALLQAVHDQLTHPRKHPEKTKRPFGATPIRDPVRRSGHPGAGRRRRTRPPRPGRCIRQPAATPRHRDPHRCG